MPWTLQRYLFREMGKTFLLTAAALTATMSLGGGVLKMVGIGELTPEQLLRLLVLIVPVSAALTLPIAALFGASSTYGRIAADNEFVACRSSGINLHVLFLPTIVLGLLSAAVTFGFWNYMIPGIIEHLDELVAQDAGSLVRQRLKNPRGIALGAGLRLTADALHTDPAHPGRMVLTDVVFVEMRGEEWSKYGAARELDVDIDLASSPAMVAAQLRGVSFYDRHGHRFVDLSEQSVPPTELPAVVPLQIKYLNLPALLHYARHVDEWHRVRGLVNELRVHVARRIVNDFVERSLRERGAVSFEGGNVTYTVRSDRPPGRVPRDGGVEVTDAVIEERHGSRLRTGAASRAMIEVVRAETPTSSGVTIEAYDARLTIDHQTIARSRETFGPAPLPRDVVERVEAMSTVELLAPVEARGERDPIVEKQEAVRHQRTRIRLDILGTINERVAFSVSVLVLVILAAGLGIVFRGSHAVVAFGISFVPSLFVIVTIIMGKQLAQNAGTHGTGLGLLWSGIALVAVLDVWTLWRLVRR